MDQQRPANIYFYSHNMYVENLIHGQEIVHRIEKAGWVLDIALEGVVEINGITLSESAWRIIYCKSEDRRIRGNVDRNVEFLSVGLHENTYVDFNLFQTFKNGIFDLAMAFPILKVISYLRNRHPNLEINVWLTCYIRLLVAQLQRANFKKSNFTYRELKNVHNAITTLENISRDFPRPIEIVRQTGMHKLRFQKACLALYGQSAQKIIQHLKMKRAFNLILVDKKTITDASSLLGYRHTPNFITAFHSHFDVTPMEVLPLK